LQRGEEVAVAVAVVNKVGARNGGAIKADTVTTAHTHHHRPHKWHP